MILVAYSIILNWVLFCFAGYGMTSSYCQRPPTLNDCQRLWATCSLLGFINFKKANEHKQVQLTKSTQSGQKSILHWYKHTDFNSAIMDWSLASLETEGGWAFMFKKRKKKSVNGMWKCNQGDFVSPSSPSSPPRLLFPLNPFIVIIMCRNLCPHATPAIDRLENRRSQLGFQG